MLSRPYRVRVPVRVSVLSLLPFTPSPLSHLALSLCLVLRFFPCLRIVCLERPGMYRSIPVPANAGMKGHACKR